jgi:aryl-alcohol dehydrogenase-like predicted oxidoreductase
MRYRTIGNDPATRREVSVLSLGAMLMGSRTDEATSLALLDRFVEAGGTFIDTSGNYAFWVNGTQGGESEELLGRWRRSRGIGDEIVIATKVGARPLAPSSGFTGSDGSVIEMDGLSAKAIRESAERSMSRMGVSRLDLMYAHIQDTSVPLSETVEGFAELVTSGFVGLLGVSNTWSWRVERARSLAAAAGLPGYEVLQYSYTYLRPFTGRPSWLSPDGDLGTAAPDLLSYLRDSVTSGASGSGASGSGASDAAGSGLGASGSGASGASGSGASGASGSGASGASGTGMTLVAYSPLLSGGYVREDKPLGPEFDHAGTERRLSALRAVAAETGATVNQVVLAWMMGGELPVIPLVGASSVAQLEESLGAVELELSAEQRARLDAAG